jgi:GDP-4-dehydro-6-deoxy-D-mannose reductase
MQPERILVTGAGGFVGRLLIPVLGAEFPNAKIIGLLRDASESSTAVSAKNIRFKAVDLVDGDLRETIRDAKPDVVLHLAAISSVQQSLGAGGSSFRENVTAGLRLLEALHAHAPEAALVFASSGEVYGRAFLSTPIASEATPIFPNNPYARSKAVLEFAVQDMLNPKGKAVCLRLFNHFGRSQDDRFVVATFASQLRAARQAKQKIIKVGNLQAKRDFLPVADVLDAYVAAIKWITRQHSGSFDLFNVASGNPRSIQSVLDDLIRLSGMNVEIVQDAARMRPSEIETAAGNSAKFTNATEWQSVADWDAALTSMLVD